MCDDCDKSDKDGEILLAVAMQKIQDELDSEEE